MKYIPDSIHPTTQLRSQNNGQVPLICSSLIILAGLYYTVNLLVSQVD